MPMTMVPPWAVESPIRAAGLPPIKTVAEPLIMLSGGPVHTQLSPTTAAGKPPIKTVGAPGPMMGPPTCGTTPVTIGQTCILLIVAAGGIFIMFLLISLYIFLTMIIFGNSAIAILLRFCPYLRCHAPPQSQPLSIALHKMDAAINARHTRFFCGY